MNLHLGKAIRITLPLAAAVLVAVMAVAFSFAPGVGADGCDTDLTPTDMHADAEGVACDGDNTNGDNTNHASDTHASMSSTLRGEAVAIRLTATAGSDIAGGGKITVDFSGPSVNNSFILPGRILNSATNRRVKINGTIFQTIEVTGKKVILTLPTTETVNSGEYTITFEESANIRNPVFSGASEITVWSESEGEESSDIDSFAVSISTRTELSISPSNGPRRSDFTLEGKGYPKGTVTIFDGDPEKGEGEILTTEETLSGKFDVSLTDRARPERQRYTVWTKDSEGVVDSATFRITKHTTSYEPARVVAGEKLRIIIEDYEEEHRGIGRSTHRWRGCLSE